MYRLASKYAPQIDRYINLRERINANKREFRLFKTEMDDLLSDESLFIESKSSSSRSSNSEKGEK